MLFAVGSQRVTIVCKEAFMKTKEKKSFTDNGIWVFFTVCTLFFLLQAAEQTVIWLQTADSLLIRGGVAGAIFMTAGFLGLGVSFVSRAVKPHRFGRICRIFLGMMFWISIAASYGFRFWFQKSWWFLRNPLGKEGAGAELGLLEHALIQRGGAESAALGGMQALYTDLLSLLFSFLGNKEELIFYFQLLLQLASLLLLFFALRIFSGKGASYGAGAALAVSSQWGAAVMRYQPEVFYMFLWSFFFFLMAVFHKLFYEQKNLSWGIQGFLFLLAGGASGMLIWFDLLGILLLPAAAGLVLAAGKREKPMPLWVRMGILSGGICLGVFLMAVRETGMKGNTVAENLRSWYARSFAAVSPKIALPSEPPVFILLLVIGACLLAAAYWMAAECNMAMWGTMLLLQCVLASAAGGVALHQGMWVTLIWGVLAGMGLQAVGKAGIVPGRQKKTEQTNPLGQLPYVELTTGVSEQRDHDQGDQGESVSRYDTSQGTRYLENPLPLPPKPVRKGMDYPLSISPEKMYYDLQVPDEDDYDHK